MRGNCVSSSEATTEAEDKNAKLRELLKDNGQKREIVLTNDGSATNPVGVYSNSGAINLTIHELIPTLHEGLDLPSTLRVVTGVTGNEIWPVNVDDVEMEEVGEVEALNDQVVNFTNITPVQNRIGLKVPVSNMAIDNAAFDLMSFVQTKFTLALRKYLAGTGAILLCRQRAHAGEGADIARRHSEGC